MSKFTMIKSLAAALLLSLTPGMHAQSGAVAEDVKLFIDEFNYTPGELADKAPEVWKNYSYLPGQTGTSAGDPVMVVENNLTYPGYRTPITGNGVQLLGAGKGTTASFYPREGAVYASMLVDVKNASAGGDFFFSFADTKNSDAGGFGKIHIKKTGTKLSFGVNRSGVSATAVWTPATYDFNRTYLLVLKYVQVPGSDNDRVELFVNPNCMGPEPAGGSLSGNTGSDPDTRIAALNLYQGQAPENSLMMDAVRVASSWKALFDASPAAKAPEIKVLPTLWLGTFVEGGAPVTGTLNIKGKLLENDITVSYTTDGYIGIPSKIIAMKDAVSLTGYNLVITLDPKDMLKNSDVMTFTSGDLTVKTDLSWAVKKATGVKIFADNFDYPAGKLADVAPAVWKDYNCFFGSSNTDSVRVVASGLTMEDYQPAAIGNSVKLLTKGRDATAAFPVIDGPIYTSMLVNVQAAPQAGDYFFSLADKYNGTSDGFGKVHIKNVDGKLAFGVTRKSPSEDAVWTVADYDFNQTYLLVLKYVQVPEKDNDIAALFVNPDISGAEPGNPIVGNTGGDPRAEITGLNLYQGRGLGSDLLVDAIRVASSWEALFDRTGVAEVPEIISGSTVYLGNFIAGGNAVSATLNVKAKNLESDITVGYATDGYFTVPNRTISKEAAQSEKGFDLVITLNPKDKEITEDVLTLTSGKASARTSLIWSYITPDPELRAENIAAVKAAAQVSFYTLANSVTIAKIDTLRSGFAFTLEDASGNLYAFDNMRVLFNKVKVGSRLVNLRLRVDAEPEKPVFSPVFSIAESPALSIDAPEAGFKLFADNFEYLPGKLVDVASAVWKDYDCFFGSTNKDSVRVVEGGLVLEGYQPQAVGNSVKLITKGRDATAAFPETGGAIYASMLVNVRNASPTGDFFFALADGYNSNTDGFGKIHIKNADGKLAFGITLKGMSDLATWTTADYEFNKTYLLVLKYAQVEGDGNDIAALFVNPDTQAAEPAGPLVGSLGIDPKTKISGLNLYQGRGLGNELLVDAIRVSVSWEELFDQPGIIKTPEINTSSDLFLGHFVEGRAPITKTLNIKAKNLESDITVSYTDDGYISIPGKTIGKSEAESETGFNLVITLNPKDAQKTTDTITFTSQSTTATTRLSWTYNRPDLELNAENIAVVKGATKMAHYTLTNDVEVIKADTLERKRIDYTIKDGTGTLVVMDYTMVLTGKVIIGSVLKNLRLLVECEPESQTFKPTFKVALSPDLAIILTGIENVSNNAITGYVNGEFIAEGAGSIKVYGLSGKLLVESSGEKISVGLLSGSIFIVRYTDKAGIVHSVKIIK